MNVKNNNTLSEYNLKSLELIWWIIFKEESQTIIKPSLPADMIPFLSEIWLRNRTRLLLFEFTSFSSVNGSDRPDMSRKRWVELTVLPDVEVPFKHSCDDIVFYNANWKARLRRVALAPHTFCNLHLTIIESHEKDFAKTCDDQDLSWLVELNIEDWLTSKLASHKEPIIHTSLLQIKFLTQSKGLHI